ncbi:hypothetical protein LTR62_001404 [Meristemomyces frigidus]|uniref:GIT Spa2 homology (SHD) domain-containing protein n=1 Tax=Meristemomyces frigidus TaxID=1508187 RepID=A0AAN7T923_9PEZI|nr:hypothetical protein LTR62_001404 [Meristemomyces frigidus]
MNSNDSMSNRFPSGSAMGSMGTTGDVAYSGGPYNAARRPSPSSLPGSAHPSGSTDRSRPSASGSSFGRPPSSASSVGRSNDGRGFSSRPDSGRSQFRPDNEMALSRHYEELKSYLAQHLADQNGNTKPNKARDKLLRLSVTQFMELSTDVYDELLRREDERMGRVANVPKSLLPRQNFHPKRNQARQKLSTLPVERFRQLATDVFYELERRIPRFMGQDMERPSSVSSNPRGPPSRNGMRPPPGGPPAGYRGPPPVGGRPPMGAPPNGMPPPPNGPYQSFRPASPAPGGLPNSRPPTDGSDSSNFNRPLPKTFQSNTIVPNKSTMVEDDEEEEDAFELDKALPDIVSPFSETAAAGNAEDREKMAAQQAELVELREKLEELESSVLSKEHDLESMKIDLSEREQELQRLKETIPAHQQELERIKSSDHEREEDHNRERDEWYNLREELEQKHLDAQRLYHDLQQELDLHKRSKSQDEHDMRSQHDRELEGLRSQMGNSHGSMIEDLQAKLKDAHSQTSDLHAQLQIHQDERDELREGLEDAHAQTSNLHVQIQSHESENEQLRQELQDAHNRTSELHAQIQHHAAEKDTLREQLESVQQRPKSFSLSDYEHRIALLQDELTDQEKLTGQVREEATRYLREMRDLSRQTDHAIEQEERLASRVSQLERKNEEWRQRYAKVKAQSLRASTMGLGLQTAFDSGSLIRKEGLVSENGLVRDVDVTRFQLAIDELLKVARRPEVEPMLESVKHIAISVHAIESAVGTDGYPTPSPSPLGPGSPGNPTRVSGQESVGKLQARVKGTANSLITATKQHATSHGLSPVALLDAAASNLTASVVELIKAVGIRPSAKDELMSEIGDEDRYSNMHSHTPSIQESLGTKLQHDSIGSFYDDRLSSTDDDHDGLTLRLPTTQYHPQQNPQQNPPATPNLAPPYTHDQAGHEDERAETSTPTPLKPLAPLNLTLGLARSGTGKKTNGWFGGWGKKAGAEDEEVLGQGSVPVQVGGVGVVGSGEGEGEYDAYR